MNELSFGTGSNMVQCAVNSSPFHHLRQNYMEKIQKRSDICAENLNLSA